jgi:hypothetical protein
MPLLAPIPVPQAKDHVCVECVCSRACAEVNSGGTPKLGHNYEKNYNIWKSPNCLGGAGVEGRGTLRATLLFVSLNPQPALTVGRSLGQQTEQPYTYVNNRRNDVALARCTLNSVASASRGFRTILLNMKFWEGLTAKLLLALASTVILGSCSSGPRNHILLTALGVFQSWLHWHSCRQRPTVPAPDDRWEKRSIWWDTNWQAKPKYSEKNMSHYHFAHHKSHMDWSRASVMRTQRLTTRAYCRTY